MLISGLYIIIITNVFRRKEIAQRSQNRSPGEQSLHVIVLEILRFGVRGCDGYIKGLLSEVIAI